MCKKCVSSIILAVALCVMVMAEGTFAADFPTRDITLVVPWAPGGATDTLARLLAADAQKNISRSVVVLNKTGGNGAIGHTYGSSARKDGYTVTLMTTESSIMHLMGSAKFTYEDFTPVALIATAPAVIAVTNDSPYKNYKDLVNAVKKSPEKIKIASLSEGSIWNLAMKLIAKESGVKFTAVPFDGGNPAITAALGKHMDAVACGYSEILPFVQDGRMRILGVTSAKRQATYDKAPTFKEQGVPVEIGAWWGIGLPKGTQEETVAKVAELFGNAINAATSQKFIKERGFEANYLDQNKFGDWLNKMDKVFKKAVE
ncbi:MAG: tripartite tricarboxylate transporter substrate binding protein [bacterium]|nr:tripartite tricarboxylate transporter substrate binding protein [bacterium]